MTAPGATPSLRRPIYRWLLIGLPVLGGVVGGAIGASECENSSGDCDMTGLAAPFFAILAFLLAVTVLVVGEIVFALARWSARTRHR